MMRVVHTVSTVICVFYFKFRFMENARVILIRIHIICSSTHIRGIRLWLHTFQYACVVEFSYPFRRTAWIMCRLHYQNLPVFSKGPTQVFFVFYENNIIHFVFLKLLMNRRWNLQLFQSGHNLKMCTIKEVWEWLKIRPV